MRTGTRSARVASSIREVVAHYLLTEAHDPRFSKMVITDVRVTPDLRIARVYFHLLVPDATESPEEIAEALRHASGRMKRAIASRMKLRVLPEFEFFYDDTLDSARRIEEILHGLDIPEESEEE